MSPKLLKCAFAAMQASAAGLCLTGCSFECFDECCDKVPVRKNYFVENYSSYFSKAPNVVQNVDGIYVGNDQVWQTNSELNVNVKGQPCLLYPKGIELKSLKDVDFQFRYRITNAKNPVAGKPEVKDGSGKIVKAAVPGIPGEPKSFEVLVNDTVIRISSDSVSLNGQTKKIPFLLPGYGGDWANAAIRVSNGKMSVYISEERKLIKQIEIPFHEPVTKLNFRALPDNGFSITDILVSDAGKLIDNPVEKHFADFRSLSQPLPQGAVKSDVSLKPDAKGFAGARIRLNEVNKVLKMVLVWSNGEKSEYPISAYNTRTNLLTNVRGMFRGESAELADSFIRVGKYEQWVRSLHRLTQGGHSGHVPQYIDILREWDRLPSASQHPLDIDFVSLPDGRVQIYLDASLADTFGAPAKKDEKVSGVQSSAKLVSVEFEGNGVSEIYAKSNKYVNFLPKYYPVDFSANPRAKAFADASSSIPEGVQSFFDVPYDVAKPLDSADIAICKQGVGNWALEVEEYHARSPFENLSSSVHFRIPAAPYTTAHMILAIDPDPAKDKILTVRMSQYQGYGIGGNMIGDAVIDLSDGKIPSNFRKIGSLTKAGKQIPLYQVDLKLNLSAIIDLASRGKYLDLDFVGKNGENTEQLDNTMKPDPHSDSAFNIFAVTLEQSPVMMDFRQSAPGNVFTEDEKAETAVTLKALRDNSKGKIFWTAKDSVGKVVFKGEKAFFMRKAQDKSEIVIPLKEDVGYYDLDIVLACDGCDTLLHEGRFAILPKDTRKWSKTESPYATWWFTTHGSPVSMDIGGPLMMKAGIRKSCNAPAPEDSLKYNIINNGNCYVGANVGDLDKNTGHFKDVVVHEKDPNDPKKLIARRISGEEAFVNKVKASMNPDLYYDHIMIWHETGPGYGIPEELINEPISDAVKKQIEDDKIFAMYINECGRIVRKHFPNLRIQIGNSSSSIGSVVRPLRAGANPSYYDAIGIEIPSQVVMPEKLQEVGFQGMMVQKDAAKQISGKTIPADGCWEFIYRPARDMGEQQQAEWHMRDILISLANRFHLISIGLLFDCTNGYYNNFYGASGIISRAPYVYPKRAYVAYAALTSALDSVKFIRQMPTGSTTVYALEFKKDDGTYAYSFWSARGAFELEADNSANKQDVLLTGFYGKKTKISGSTLKLACGTAPVYLNTNNPLKSVKISGRSFPEENARAMKSTQGSSFDDTALITVSPDMEIESKRYSYLPIMKPGSFSVSNVVDAEKGKAIQVTLNLKDNPYKSKYITEYTTLRLKEPVAIQGNPSAVGVWVKGNSNWGQIRFEIEDAQGEVFKGICTDGWGCDVYDWPGNTCVNFDGWSYVAQPLFPTKLFCNHSPGPVKEQWVSCGGDKKIDLPIKIRAITVGFNRYKLDLLEFKESAPSILIKGVGGVEE